jgi:hypothetical protein
MGAFTYSLAADKFAACSIEDVFHLAESIAGLLPSLPPSVTSLVGSPTW